MEKNYLTKFNNDERLIPIMNCAASKNGAKFNGITVTSFCVDAWYAMPDDADEEETIRIEGKLVASILKKTKHRVTANHIQPVNRFLVKVSIMK